MQYCCHAVIEIEQVTNSWMCEMQSNSLTWSRSPLSTLAAQVLHVPDLQEPRGFVHLSLLHKAYQMA